MTPHPLISYTRSPVILKRVIGKGSHGTVYSGYHTRLDKLVAVKLVRDNYSSRAEIEALNDLQECQHVVRYMDTYGDDETDQLSIVMELCLGKTGSAWIERVREGKPITEKQIRHMAQGMANVILHCHERGILYGDIKPENVIFTPHQEAIMVDFGCARYGERFGMPLGTPLYFAPEKFTYDYGLASDTWSLGLIMYMLICGHHPFVHLPSPNGGLVELQAEIECTRLTFHHPNWDMVTDSMKDMLAGMLQKDPAKRTPMEYVISHKWWCANL